jgi:hypothetical protein
LDRLRVFENRVLRGIFGLMRDEVTGGWRKLHHEELRDLYSSPSIIRIIESKRMRCVGHVSMNGGEEMLVGYLLVGKPEGKKLLGRPRHGRVDNIRMDLGEVGCGDVEWIGLVEQVECYCEFGIEPSSSMKCWETIEWLHNCRPLE